MRKKKETQPRKKLKSSPVQGQLCEKNLGLKSAQGDNLGGLVKKTIQRV